MQVTCDANEMITSVDAQWQDLGVISIFLETVDMSIILKTETKKYSMLPTPGKS